MASDSVGKRIGAYRRRRGLSQLAGALWLIAALIAARRTDQSEARRRLDVAEGLAGLLGHDGNYAWTAFGPTNVAIHRVSVAAELGDPAESVRYNVIAREMIREMLARNKRSGTSALHDLAVRAGVLH